MKGVMDVSELHDEENVLLQMQDDSILLWKYLHR